MITMMQCKPRWKPLFKVKLRSVSIELVDALKSFVRVPRIPSGRMADWELKERC